MKTPPGQRRQWHLRHAWIHNQLRECRNADCPHHKSPLMTPHHHCGTCKRALYPAHEGKP